MCSATAKSTRADARRCHRRRPRATTRAQRDSARSPSPARPSPVAHWRRFGVFSVSPATHARRPPRERGEGPQRPTWKFFCGERSRFPPVREDQERTPRATHRKPHPLHPDRTDRSQSMRSHRLLAAAARAGALARTRDIVFCCVCLLSFVTAVAVLCCALLLLIQARDNCCCSSKDGGLLDQTGSPQVTKPGVAAARGGGGVDEDCAPSRGSGAHGKDCCRRRALFSLSLCVTTAAIACKARLFLLTALPHGKREERESGMVTTLWAVGCEETSKKTCPLIISFLSRARCLSFPTRHTFQ